MVHAIKNDFFVVFRSIFSNSANQSRSYLHSEKQRKTSFPFVFPSFFRNFANN